jgi:hypothetical protein
MISCLPAGLLTYTFFVCLPIRQVANSDFAEQKNDTYAVPGAYSSGNCPGLTPGSLLISTDARTEP